MNDYLKKVSEKIKKPKVFMGLGIAGILLIFISGFIKSDTNSNTNEDESRFSAAEYKAAVANDVEKIVERITGDKKPTVVVTVDSGMRYSYADKDETDSSSSQNGQNAQSSEKSKREYVTVKDSSGGEKALVVAEYLPEIRGVAVICEGGNDPELSEIIKNAVTSALNISSKRVYISGGNN